MRDTIGRLALFVVALAFVGAAPAAAQSASPSAAAARGPQPYDAFVKDATVQTGLIPIIKKNGKVYLALAKSQLGQDFIQTAVPATGLGGFGPAAGEPYVAPARIFRFDRNDDTIVMRWPNTYARVTAGTPEATSTSESLPASVVAVEPIVAEDDKTVVVSASPFLGDVANFAAVFSSQIDNPMHGYRLDPDRSFFTTAKAFEKNDVLRVSQTWYSSDPNLIDNAPDARSLEVTMTYNIIAPPNDSYMPRIDDPRIGYFSQPLLNFGTDRLETRNLYYIIRWNFAPQTPGRPSNATHPLVFFLSNTIPMVDRNAVREALMQWNAAFAKIGILNAVQVQDQPTDASWDPDDLSHNVVRWIDTSSPQYGAEALIISDPRTGEELNVGVNVDSVEGYSPALLYRFVVAPARGLHDSDAAEAAFTHDLLLSVVLHESGHDFGLQHNFIGSTAYTAKNLQSRAFTARYGVANSVMEYAPMNLWPKGTPQGDYFQKTVGPYDYYAIRYGYQYIPNATTPEQELPTLRRWASAWSNPYYRFASDEDVDFASGHAIDPRVAQNDLTNRPVQWCATQLAMLHGVMNAVNRRFPAKGLAYDEARRAFLTPLRSYTRCAAMPAHVIGGEYLSRAAAGDPRSTMPLTAVSRADNYAAWLLMQKWLFSDAAWKFNPAVLDRLTYSEAAPFTGGSWTYDPTARHDVPIVEFAALAQDRVLDELFAPLRLQRIDELNTKYSPKATIGLTDLFNWSQGAIFGDLANGKVANDGVVRRNLQVRYAKRLAQIWDKPDPGTPSDAQALARFELMRLERDASAAANNPKLDDLTRAHAGALTAIAKEALSTHPNE